MPYPIAAPILAGIGLATQLCGGFAGIGVGPSAFAGALADRGLPTRAARCVLPLREGRCVGNIRCNTLLVPGLESRTRADVYAAGWAPGATRTGSQPGGSTFTSPIQIT